MRMQKSIAASIVILALTACSTNSETVTPTSSASDTPASATASPPETSFSAEAVVIVTKAFYDEYMDCMTNPPAEAIGQVGNWCSSNNSNATSNFPANLEAGGVAEAGADPIVCAQSFPMSYIVEDNATYSSSENLLLPLECYIKYPNVFIIAALRIEGICTQFPWNCICYLDYLIEVSNISCKNLTSFNVQSSCLNIL